ncbi:MAG TPA: hypothetical protein VD932_03810 [Aquabacterium sp.]|nr:hypothetical protein [Aquabacterium sp.]
MSLALLERFDQFAGLRNALSTIGEQRQHLAGIPMPLQDLPLTVHPRYPMADALMSMSKQSAADDDEQDFKIRNQFWSTWMRTTVVVVEHKGKIKCVPAHPANHVDQLINTIGASDAWGIQQEQRALQLLGTLVKHHTFKHYLLTGCFLETSDRSGVTYLFRKLRPTLALSGRTGRIRILAALCSHPIAYYQNSWGGAMCPTDDVVAHLMMMRGDEHMFWKRSNQHEPSTPQAGI